MNDTITDTTADRFRRLAADFVNTVDRADPTATTPCEGWVVGDVAEHVRSTQQDFLRQRSIDVAADADLPTVFDAMQAALDDPTIADASYDGYFGPTTLAETVDAFYCLDLVLHRWDIAVASGLDTSIQPKDIERCRRLLEPMGDNVRMPGIFGPAVEVTADATDQDRFVAWTGRDPGFQRVS